MKYFAIFLILFAVSVSAQTMDDTIPILEADVMYALNMDFSFGYSLGGSGSVVETFYLLREDASRMLREDGAKFLREDAP